MFPYFDEKSPEVFMVDKLTSMWTDFAKTSKPLSAIDIDNVNWLPFKSENNNYLDISVNLTLRNDIPINRYKLWDAFFPI